MKLEQEFRKELAEHMPHLSVFARSLTRDRTEWEDLVHDTMERALDNWEKYDPNRSMRTWLFTVMRNIHVGHMRSRANKGDYVQNPDTLPEIIDDSQSFDRETYRTAVEAIEMLPSEQRSALYLVGFDGRSYKEAGEILGVAEGTVKSRVSRARETVAEALAGMTGMTRNKEGPTP